MHSHKSYMLPKLIFLNMLALMMITFEHESPADNRYFLKAVNAGEGLDSPSNQALQLAEANEPLTEDPKPVPAVIAKKSPAQHRQVSHQSSPKAKTIIKRVSYHANSPLGCCFRGNYS